MSKMEYVLLGKRIKYVIKVVVITWLVVAFSFAVGAFFFLKYHFAWKDIGICNIKDAESGYSIEVTQQGEPLFRFPCSVRVTVNDGNGKRYAYVDVSVETDGRNLRAEDVEVLWGEDNVTVILHGWADKDEVLEFMLEA